LQNQPCVYWSNIKNG